MEYVPESGTVAIRFFMILSGLEQFVTNSSLFFDKINVSWMLPIWAGVHFRASVYRRTNNKMKSHPTFDFFLVVPFEYRTRRFRRKASLLGYQKMRSWCFGAERLIDASLFLQPSIMNYTLLLQHLRVD